MKNILFIYNSDRTKNILEKVISGLNKELIFKYKLFIKDQKLILNYLNKNVVDFIITMNDNSNDKILELGKKKGTYNICIQHSIVPMFDNIFLTKYIYSPLSFFNRSKLYKSKNIDLFLSYGDYFKNYLKKKNKEICSIGNINNQLNIKLSTNNINSKKNILFVDNFRSGNKNDLNDLQKINNIFLKYQMQGYKITYRIHPRSNKTLYQNLFYISKNKDLYKDIENAEYIFGISSTALIEGLILNKKIIKLTNYVLNYIEPIWLNNSLIHNYYIEKKPIILNKLLPNNINKLKQYLKDYYYLPENYSSFQLGIKKLIITINNK